jgi:hypothetical protein
MTREEITQFVASLVVPEERREVILAELLDHLESSAADAGAGLGDLAALRARFEKIEPAFAFGVRDALLRAAAAIAAATSAAVLLHLAMPEVSWQGSPAAEMIVEGIPTLLSGILLSILLYLFTPAAVWAQLSAASREGGFRRAWRWASPAERAAAARANGAICYLAVVLYGVMLAGLVAETVTGIVDFAAAFVVPVTLGFFALLAAAIRQRRRLERGFPVE